MGPVIECPYCRRALNLPGQVPAGPVQCPACGKSFDCPAVIVEDQEVVRASIPGVPPPPPPLAPVLISSSKESGGGDDRDLEMQRCRRCGARISSALQRCLSCGVVLVDEEERPWERSGGPLRRDIEPHRGVLISTIGRLSVCLAVPGLFGIVFPPLAIASLLASGLGLTCSLMARDDLDQMDRKVMDPEGWQATESGRRCASWAMMLGIIGLLLAAVRLPIMIVG
jgi:hypothetical protein